MTQEDPTAGFKSGPGRPPRAGGVDKWHVNIPTELALFWRVQLADPVTARMPNGAMSGLVERLLREEARKMGYTGA